MGYFPAYAQGTPTPEPTATATATATPYVSTSISQYYTLTGGQMAEVRFSISAGEILIAGLLTLLIVVLSAIYYQARIDHER